MPTFAQHLGVVAVLCVTRGCHAASFSPPICVGNITEFPNCDKVESILLSCRDLSKSETIHCFCTQELLNAYIGCKSEFRQCALGDTFDSVVDEWIAEWDRACSPYLPDTITTPVASEATRTLEADTCVTLIESCFQLSASITSCSTAYDRPAEVTSCRCQESIVSLASVCSIDGPEICEGTPAVTSNIWELRYCKAATDVLRTSDLRISEATSILTEAPDTSTTDTGSQTTTLSFGSDATISATDTGGETTTLSFGLDTTATSTTASGTASKGSTMDWKVSLMLVLVLACL